MAKFPSPEWVDALVEKLNSDGGYAQAAKNWEGDMVYVIFPSGSLKSQVAIYFDLWHGKCRQAHIVPDGVEQKAFLTVTGTYDNILRVMQGTLDPIQGMITRRLLVHGNMAVLLTNLPTVMNFVRCCREVTDSFV